MPVAIAALLKCYLPLPSNGFSVKSILLADFLVTGINNMENWIDDVRHWPKLTDEGNLLTT